ncbi:hypothetical protein DER45DRAFT_540222 [Fusarium avenaceum]|nr:hypothetical protein DER45DRAFT_540222 [Fusarium avenaceum]
MPVMAITELHSPCLSSSRCIAVRRRGTFDYWRIKDAPIWISDDDTATKDEDDDEGQSFDDSQSCTTPTTSIADLGPDSLDIDGTGTKHSPSEPEAAIRMDTMPEVSPARVEDDPIWTQNSHMDPLADPESNQTSNQSIRSPIVMLCYPQKEGLTATLSKPEDFLNWEHEFLLQAHRLGLQQHLKSKTFLGDEPAIPDIRKRRYMKTATAQRTIRSHTAESQDGAPDDI